MRGYYILKNEYKIFSGCNIHITSVFDIVMRVLCICKYICCNIPLEHIDDMNSYSFSDNDVLICIGKKRRLFYKENNSIHSMYFPFSLNDEHQLILYNYNSELSETINVVISALCQMSNCSDKTENAAMEAIENYFQDNYLDISGELFDDCKRLLNDLYNLDCGYLRYDYDTSGKVGHPLNHLDIYFDDAVEIKLALADNKMIGINEMVNICNIFDDEIDVKYILQQKQ